MGSNGNSKGDKKVIIVFLLTAFLMILLKSLIVGFVKEEFLG